MPSLIVIPRFRSWPRGLLVGLVLFALGMPTRCLGLEPIPSKLVVLTFDDSARSHFEVVRPILIKYGFGATFFITEGFDFATNKRDYMTWDEIAELHRDGFEIGNHTRDHLAITEQRVDQVAEQLTAIRDACRQHQIPDPVSFAWPGNAFTTQALERLKQLGIRFARRGGAPEFPYERGRGCGYEPGTDHPLLIPTAGDARPDWEFDDFRRALDQGGGGKVIVLQFHGVPDTAHPWVNTSPDKFEMYMSHLAREKYQVIAMRDLAKYVDPDVAPQDPEGVIVDRQARLARGQTFDSFRRPRDERELRFWLDNMAEHHRYSIAEMQAATGLSVAELSDALTRFGLTSADGIGASATRPDATPTPIAAQAEQPAVLRVLPYPGGRHPRTGFRDGALRPQRETKLSLFAPWEDGGYVVADFPEAIWWEPATGRELLYLAHTHVPTVWDRQQLELQPVEWQAIPGGWAMERALPNGVSFGTQAIPGEAHVRFEMWVRNGTPETLRGVVVQNCVMLARATGFEAQSDQNTVIRHPLVACRNAAGDAWVITAWQSCQRPWANPPCPCIHSDPQFPDCLPGQTSHLTGWVSFYRGTDIEGEFDRIERLLTPE